MSALLSLLAAVSIASATPIPPSQISPKLALFDRTQVLCTGLVLSSQSFAEEIATSSVSSLRDVCECTGLLSVAPLSDEQATSVMTGDKARPEFLKAMSTAMDRCIKLNEAK